MWIKQFFRLVVITGVIGILLGTAVFAANADFNELVSQIPEDTDDITYNDFPVIRSAWEKYLEMDTDERLDLDFDSMKRLTNAYTTIQIHVVGHLVNEIDELPDVRKLKKSKQDEVLNLYSEYQFLKEDIKSEIQEKHRKKLFISVAKFDKAKLTDDERALISEELQTMGSADDTRLWGLPTWELVVIGILLALLLPIFAIEIYVTVKSGLLSSGKKTNLKAKSDKEGEADV